MTRWSRRGHRVPILRNSTTLSKSPTYSAGRESIPRAHQKAAEPAASRRCSTCARRNNWCIPRRPTIPEFNKKSSNGKSDQLCCSGRIPAAWPADAVRCSRIYLPRFRPACHRHCLNGVLNTRRGAESIAANAKIGVAKAAYFPQLSPSGFLGGQSTQLSSLVQRTQHRLEPGSELSQPIFTAGRLKSKSIWREPDENMRWCNTKRLFRPPLRRSPIP